MIIVVGGGASGSLCAYKLKEKGLDVLLIEKNNAIGKKINITGKGRCNLTNDCNEKEFIENIVRNGKFLYSSINTFSSKDTMNFFESKGVFLEITRGNRVFPKSMDARDISNALYKALKSVGVNIHFEEEVINITKENDIFKVITNKATYVADKVIIATGGKSYPLTGSTGDGHKFAKSFSHTVTDLVPGLCGLRIKDEIDSKLFKYTIKNVTMIAKTPNHEFKEFGDITFYKGLIAGPIALTLSSLINRINPNDVELSVDFKPALSFDQLDKRLIREVQNVKNNTIEDILKTLLPTELIPWFAKVSSIKLENNIKQLSKENREYILNCLKNFKINYDGLDDISRATVTSGGVDIKEINSSTMESKLVKNLYFIGEIIDVDAFTGGFNLQIAFSTAATLAANIE